MITRFCVDAVGLEGLLTVGKRYRLQPGPCGVVRVVRASKTPLVVCGSRFSEVAP